VTDIGALDRLVQYKVVQAFGRHELGQAFGTQSVTGEQLVQHIWNQLVSSLSSGRLSNVRLVQSRDLSFEYAG
jgi:6-pyruvoyltetrahydropterin/6-carboxytetrahydropterin synthase